MSVKLNLMLFGDLGGNRFVVAQVLGSRVALPRITCHTVRVYCIRMQISWVVSTTKDWNGFSDYAGTSAKRVGEGVLASIQFAIRQKWFSPYGGYSLVIALTGAVLCEGYPQIMHYALKLRTQSQGFFECLTTLVTINLQRKLRNSDVAFRIIFSLIAVVCWYPTGMYRYPTVLILMFVVLLRFCFFVVSQISRWCFQVLAFLYRFYSWHNCWKHKGVRDLWNYEFLILYL